MFKCIALLLQVNTFERKKNVSSYYTLNLALIHVVIRCHGITYLLHRQEAASSEVSPVPSPWNKTYHRNSSPK